MTRWSASRAATRVPGLFSQLKEVYLFGCNTLNAEAMRSASAEIGRSLVRSGYSPADAERLSRVLDERHGESNRDRMRHIFKDVPVIYGFSSKAPLGRTAGPLLERYFQSGAGGEIGSGRASAKLLNLFAPSSMTVTAGMTDSDPRAGFRRDTCHFSDDRLSAAQKLGFVHEVLGREMAEVRMFLDHLEKYSASLGGAERQAPPVSAALDEIAHDAARARALSRIRARCRRTCGARPDAGAGARSRLALAGGTARGDHADVRRAARAQRGGLGRGGPCLLAQREPRAARGAASAATGAGADRQGRQCGDCSPAWEARKATRGSCAR